MKLSEVIAELEKDPSKKFEAASYSDKVNIIKVDDNGYYRMDIYRDGGKLIPQELGGGNFNGNVGKLDNWKEVEQPVTWQEAIEAWVDGAKISYLTPKGHRQTMDDHYLIQVYGNFHKSNFKTYKWFIEAKS